MGICGYVCGGRVPIRYADYTVVKAWRHPSPPYTNCYGMFNPSNAEATFLQSTRAQIF